MEEQGDEVIYELAFDINGIKILKGVIDYAIETWPGSPRRPAHEQDFLHHMKSECNRFMMEHNFHNLSLDKDK